ncbi:FMNH2-dependent monooxygenase [Subtercola sp. Z020]|uniref:NtaA/DmoA family FMN-dependent monooxygenase n=1 Tax=Subtercola sp. Z020 TaxID=2080582 RepID=UPI000CE8DB9C|nr:NtaA/DmoA family FMN-dependent monooxygenase [Subtercola sp. Z020]PPF88281.1 FMNH2-dependent monooxygenase [Subtercola sp. Z020]
MFHLGWFYNYGFGAYGLNDPWSGNVRRDVAHPELFIQTAQALETAGFDYIMLEDASVLPDIHEGSFAPSVRAGAIRQDPFPLIPLIAAQTKHIGIIGTMATSFYPPFIGARLINTLDHLTGGRVGVNLVTASPDAAAQNFGHEKHFEHDLRYRMAGEWIEAVKALWNTWDRDAVNYGDELGDFADPSKVHYANFQGEFFSTRGPLNVIPSPQYHPVICQAGGSGVGRAFAAGHADTIIAAVHGVDQMREYKQDISRLLVEKGRAVDDAKLLHLISPVLGETDDEANTRRKAQQQKREEYIDASLSGLSYMSGIDFSTFDLDAPLPEIDDRVNGHKSSMATYVKISQSGKTLRETLLARSDAESIELVGSAETIADKMEETMEQVGGDGFLISSPVTRRNVAEIADGLAPVLRRRGLIRDGYAHKTLRENLLDF